MNSIRNIQKKIKKGIVQPRPVDRLAVARHRRGSRGHEGKRIKEKDLADSMHSGSGA